ncbi:AbiJ-NTD4 domain-containing protein [Tenacibaculum sp. nBUS_03]|uniref:AbiJ-NTD4 domain-containing protein n=1 Tax=Tenacibaculum sp. nBUS_03 TaxID=3395320 RepID=UPI003EC119EB
MKFSERIGVIKAKDTIQLDYIDNDLRNGLWNGFQIYYLDNVNQQWIYNSYYNEFLRNLWHNFFKLPLDTLDSRTAEIKAQIREWFFNWEWFEVYDFIEFVSKTKSPTNSYNFINFCNGILEKEISGYRFVNGIIAPITSESEITEIDSAISNTGNSVLTGVKIHLETALRKMADRNTPDYRNSIKESISAVESLAKVISNNDKDSLGGALNKIKGKINLHPSLERGFKQIYGYTSDADGIRHALTEESTCDFEDAKYILVSSSAFINYLIIKANKAGIKT